MTNRGTLGELVDRQTGRIRESITIGPGRRKRRALIRMIARWVGQAPLRRFGTVYTARGAIHRIRYE